jgi:hypothetical protein
LIRSAETKRILPRAKKGNKVDEQLQTLTETPAFHENLIAPEAQAEPALPKPIRSSHGKPLITTMDLSASTCRWPFGDPAEPDFHYCGETPRRNGPYCDAHTAASSPASRRNHS